MRQRCDLSAGSKSVRVSKRDMLPVWALYRRLPSGRGGGGASVPQPTWARNHPDRQAVCTGNHGNHHYPLPPPTRGECHVHYLYEHVFQSQLAGLCHDLGHGPFSHLFDMLVVPALPGDHEDWSHEQASTWMFDHIAESKSEEFEKWGLTEEDRMFIKNLIDPSPEVWRQWTDDGWYISTRIPWLQTAVSYCPSMGSQLFTESVLP